MTPAVKPLQDILGWAGSFGPSEYMQWSPEAEKKFTEFFHVTMEPEKKLDQSDMITRVDLLLKKLILLLTANQKLKVVPEEVVDAAISCYTYIVESYRLVSGEVGSTLQSEVADAIMAFAKKEFERNGRGVSLSSLARTLKRRKYPYDVLIKTCDNLVKIGFLKLEQANKNSVGRPTVRYKYVD
jgi:hypothetical protein